MNITLSRNGVTAVSQSYGAELKSCGNGLIWYGDPEIWANHTPVLFPIVGGLKDGRVTFGGETLEIRKHGFARYSEFELEETDGESVTWLLKPNDEIRKMYPFDFEFRVRHTLVSCGFETAYTVTNTGSVTMPFCIGGHPAFNVPNYKRWSLEFSRAEDCDYYNVNSEGMLDFGRKAGHFKGRELPFFKAGKFGDKDAVSEGIFAGDIFAGGAVIMPDIKSREVVLKNDSDTVRIRFDFSDFDMLAFWTPPGKSAPFVCLEPWCGMPACVGESGRFEDKPYARMLGSGETKEFKFRVSVMYSR